MGTAMAKPQADTKTASTASSAPASSCDMTGRWLVALHKVTDGLGNLQYVHNYLYYEIAQSGDAFSVTKSLYCGTDVVGGGAFAVTVDYRGAAAGVMKRVSHDGRKGTSTSAAEGCMVSFEKQYSVQGATVPYYLDPSTTLPSADQPAMNGQPGWEDWDEDQHPGITGHCEGTVTGQIYTAARDWTSYTGAVPDVASAIKLSMSWDQEPNVMAFDGSPFLGSSAVRAADASLHFAQLARLKEDQATGDDASICQSVVSLAPMLTPDAAGM
jgi:hypothetical protein